MAKTIKNAILDGVEDRIKIKNDNAISMSYPNDTFGVVVSNLCLHNIYNAEDRKKSAMKSFGN